MIIIQYHGLLELRKQTLRLLYCFIVLLLAIIIVVIYSFQIKIIYPSLTVYHVSNHSFDKLGTSIVTN